MCSHIHLHHAEDTLPLSPPAITSVASNSPSSLTISWIQSDIEAVDYYQLSFSYTGPCEGHKHQRMVRVSARMREYTITGLQEYSQYEIQVTAVRGSRRARSSTTGNTAEGRCLLNKTSFENNQFLLVQEHLEHHLSRVQSHLI